MTENVLSAEEIRSALSIRDLTDAEASELRDELPSRSPDARAEEGYNTRRSEPFEST